MTAKLSTVSLESVPAESHTGDCAAPKGGYVCTLTPGHAGPIHVSHGTEAAVVWERARIAPSERHPNRTRERPAGRSQDEIRVSKRAARYARPFIFGMDE